MLIIGDGFVAQPFSYGRSKTVIASGAKQSPVIPVETGIQEGRMAMRPYKIVGGTGILPVISEETGWKPVPPFTPRDDRSTLRVIGGLHSGLSIRLFGSGTLQCQAI